MSRLIKKPIIIPEKVKVTFKDKLLSAQGPNGQDSLEIPDEVGIDQKANEIFIKPGKKTHRTKNLLGTFHSLTNNLVTGVDKGHEKRLTYKGVGYTVEAQGNKLKLSIGYSHPIDYEAPKTITFEVKKNVIIVKGVNKQVVGEVAAQIRKTRKVDPYKQKGIKYEDERVIEKEGKVVEKDEG